MPWKWDKVTWRILSFLYLWARWPHTYWRPCLSFFVPHCGTTLCSSHSVQPRQFPLWVVRRSLCWLSWCHPPWHPNYPQITCHPPCPLLLLSQGLVWENICFAFEKRSLTGGLNHCPLGQQEWESDSKRKNQPGVFFLLPCFLPHPIQMAWKGCQWLQAQRKEDIFHVPHEIHLHWSLVQQEAGLALIKTKVGNKTETFISCSTTGLAGAVPCPQHSFWGESSK